MAADALRLHRQHAELAHPVDDLVLPLEHLLESGGSVGQRPRVVEDLARQAARPVVQRLAIERGEWFRSEIGVPVVRGQRLMELRCPLSQQGRPLEVRAHEEMSRFELAPVQGEEAARRSEAELDVLAMGQRFLEAVRQGIDDVVPPVVLVRDELFEHGHGGRGRARRVGAVLHAPPAERRVGEAGALAQEAPNFDARVDALFETPDELHDGAVPEEDRAVRLFGREGHGRVVLGDELVELP